jgi:phenylalanyl-tRNA synthetase alpha chain
MKDKIEQLKKEILSELEKIKESDALESLETKYLGRKGEFTAILRKISSLSEDERREIGRIANETKNDLLARFGELKDTFSPDKGAHSIDVTEPGKKFPSGQLHPITKIQRDLEELFETMGFMVLDGPELESDYFNFTALNIPAWHPARDMQDTFYIDHLSKRDDYDLVMRTHTSPMQVRAMKKYGAPLRCVIPGRVFRNEATDAVHEHTLHQIEGLMIGENISVSNLISVLKETLSGIFKQDVKIRVRPGFFAFTEPSLEVDMQCTICGGKKCPSCKHSGWLEMLGSGMVHPNVLRAGGIDPDKYTGFAFGLGIDRLVMMKYSINDIRHFMGGDLRFLKQF